MNLDGSQRDLQGVHEQVPGASLMLHQNAIAPQTPVRIFVIANRSTRRVGAELHADGFAYQRRTGLTCRADAGDLSPIQYHRLHDS